jgi:hypothetical protein
MTEQAPTADNPQPATGDAPRDGAAARVEALEGRVRRLEDALAALQDTRALEERVVERVAAKVGPGDPNGLRESAGLIMEAGRHLLPAAAGALAGGADAAEAHARAQAQPAAPGRRPWLLFEVYAELRAMVRMYVDPRFRLTWQARLLPLVLLVAIATSGLWLPGNDFLNKITLNIVGTLYEKVVDLALAFVLFKVLHREVSRYRQSSPDLPPSLRL